MYPVVCLPVPPVPLRRAPLARGRGHTSNQTTAGSRTARYSRMTGQQGADDRRTAGETPASFPLRWAALTLRHGSPNKAILTTTIIAVSAIVV